MQDRQQRAREIFEEAIDIVDETRRGEFIRRACGADSELLSIVTSLLNANREVEGILETQDVDRPARPDAAREGKESPQSTTDSVRDYARSEMIGPYKLLQEIGSGGMGQVWMAEQLHPVRRRVAMKLIKAGMDSKLVIARFEAERQALALMDHPHIAKVFDAGTTSDGRPFFVMEYVKGKPVTTFADDNHLTIPERLELFEQICNAVQHAHHKGIIHRDLKPNNVLVSAPDGRPLSKVIDFGIAKATSQQLTDLTLFTLHNQFIGTPQYMSPEQAAGSVDIDTRTDVYSLGVILFELLTGSTPFPREELRKAGLEQMKKIIIEKEPPKPSTRISLSEPALETLAACRRVEPRRLGLLVRGELDWIVMKALDKDRSRRYETPNNLADDIMAYLQGDPIHAAPPSRRYRLQKFVRKNKGPVIATVAFSGLLGLGLIGTSWGYYHAQNLARLERDAKFEAIDARNKEADARKAAELEAYIANIGLAQTAIANDNWPEARQRLAACPAYLRGWEWEILNKQASAVIAKLPTSRDHNDNTIFPRLSPSRDSVLCHVNRETMRFFDLDGKPLGPPIVHPGPIVSVEFCVDSRNIVTLCEDGNVRVWAEQGNLIREYLNAEKSFDENWSILWASDARAVLKNGRRFLSINPRAELKFVDVVKNRTIAVEVIQAEVLPMKNQVLVRAEESFQCFSADGRMVWELDISSFAETNPYIEHIAANGEVFSTLSGNYGEGPTYSLVNCVGELVASPVVRGDECRLSFSCNGEYIVGVSEENGIVAWKFESDIGKLKELAHLPELRGDMDLTISNDGSAFLALDDNEDGGELSIWETTGKRCAHKIPVPEGSTYYNEEDLFISDGDNIVWAEFGHTGYLECRNRFGKRKNFASNAFFGSIRSAGTTSAIADTENSNTTVWNIDGTVRMKLGSLQTNVASCPPEASTLLLNEYLINPAIRSDGVTHFEAGPTGISDMDSVLEFCGPGQQNATTGFQLNSSVGSEVVVRDSDGETTFRFGATFGNVSATLLSDHSRMVVADGKLLRFFETGSWREVGTFHLGKPIESLRSSADGLVLIAQFHDHTALMWDLFDTEQTQVRWDRQFNEIAPAEKYLDNLFDSHIPNELIVESIMKDPAISEVARRAIIRFGLYRLEMIEKLADSARRKIMEPPNPYEKWERIVAARNQLESQKDYDRVLAKTVELLASYGRPVSERRVINFATDILHERFNRPHEYKEALTAVNRAISEFGETPFLTHLSGCAHYRLGNIDESLKWLARSKQLYDVSEKTNHSNLICEALCEASKNNMQAARNILEEVELKLKGQDTSGNNYRNILLREARGMLEDSNGGSKSNHTEDQ